MIRYFISYSFQAAGGIGFANADVPMTAPIRSLQDVAVIKQWLLKQGIENPVVLSFSRFDDEAGSREAR